MIYKFYTHSLFKLRIIIIRFIYANGFFLAVQRITLDRSF